MEILKKKYIAMLIMSAIIFGILVLATKTSIVEAIIILLVLLAVFTTIDFVSGLNSLQKSKHGLPALLLE